MQSNFYNNICQQPDQWIKCLEYSRSDIGKSTLLQAHRYLIKSKRIIISAIGASYNAGVAVKWYLSQHFEHVILEDTSEMLNDFAFQEGDVVLFLSRSGKSIELVKVAKLAAAKKITVLSICNDTNSPLASLSKLCSYMNVDFDHSISVATSTAIALVGQLLANASDEKALEKIIDALVTDIEEIKSWLPVLDKQCKNIVSGFGNSAFYFLGRGLSLSAVNSSVLLWEEGAKMPASMKTTGSFRHGPQEIISSSLHVVLWLDTNDLSYNHDLSLCQDLRKLGVNLITIGGKDDVPSNILLPSLSSYSRVLAETLPVQLLAAFLSEKTGANPDEFKFCDFIVDKEGGIL